MNLALILHCQSSQIQTGLFFQAQFSLKLALNSLHFKQWALSSNTKGERTDLLLYPKPQLWSGKRRAERECLLDLQWKVNEQRRLSQAFLFLASQQQWSRFYFFFSVNLLKRMEEEEEEEGTCMEGKNCDGNQPRAHCHSLEVFIFNRFTLFLGHQRIYWKRTRVTQQVFMRLLLH